MRPIEVPEHHAIARTGTNLSREEREVETSQSLHEPSSGGSMSPASVAETRSLNATATSPNDPFLADNTGSISHSQEVYRLEWFAVLVFMLLLSISELIIFVLLTVEVGGSGRANETVNGPDGLTSIFSGSMTALIACPIIWTSVTLYTAFLICLTEYHKAVGNNLDRFMFIPRRVQHMSIRVIAYMYGLLCLIGLAASLYVFDFHLI